MKKTKTKKVQNKNIAEGKIFIQATFNNTLITVCDSKGNTLSWSSAGANGFKGARKATPYAAATASKVAIEKAKVHGLKQVSVFIAGVGPGREQAVRAIGSTGLKVTSIKDVTPVPHNGVRRKKPRRV